MRSAKAARVLLLAVSVTAYAACGGDSPGVTDPDPDPIVDTIAAKVAATNVLLSQMDDAMAALSQSASAGGVPGAVMDGGLSLRATMAEAPPPPDAAKCIFDEATVRHVCPNFTQKDGLVIKSWFQFLDAQLVPHKDPDTAKTVAIRRYFEKSGTVQGQHTSQAGTVPSTNTYLNKDTLTLVGLKGPPAGRKLNGRGTMDVTLSPQGQPQATIKVATMTEGFAFVPPPPPPEKPTVRYPISGKVTATVTSQRADMPQAGSTTTQVTTYDGSKIAKLVISLANGTVLKTCTWDMTVAGPPICT